MSIILDALRVGGGKPAAGATSTPAQTDAILQTLGYGRTSLSPLDRLTRVVVYLGLALAVVSLLAVAVIWLVRLYTLRDSGAAMSQLGQLESPNGKVIFFPDGSITRS